MVSLDIKSDSKTSSPISLALGNTKDEPTLSFSNLLKGVSLKDSKDDKNIQNGAFVLSLGAELKESKLKSSLNDTKFLSKEDTLASLLKGEKLINQDKVEILVLNPELSKKLTTAEIKTLISDAKEFLKDKIVQSDGYKRAEAKDLPKTLKGLAQMAKIFGIELNKITIEQVQHTNKSTPLLKESTKIELNSSEKIVTEADDAKIIKDIKSTQKNEVTSEDVLNRLKPKVKSDKSVKVQSESELTQEVKIKDDKKIEVLKVIKATPLFKAQEKVSLSTEQIVQTKQFKVEEKTTNKTKADETLKLLLRGEKPSLSLGNMTKDFSVATARVIAPTATTETSKSLDHLLRGNVEESGQKLDGLATHKADSFEVKVNEAKQMVKYLSQDVKTAIEDYKSPFTRVKVQLNPHKLGEVDVTIVQRGKNLHVNISSNTAAINTLAINANELKAQLTTNGINNASLNFNNSSQNSEQQNSKQQQSPQDERRADEEYNYFEQEEHNEEVISSLEIVVPNYA